MLLFEASWIAQGRKQTIIHSTSHVFHGVIPHDPMERISADSALAKSREIPFFLVIGQIGIIRSPDEVKMICGN